MTKRGIVGGMIAAWFCGGLVMGCTSNKDKPDGRVIVHQNEIPATVQGSFHTQHPGAVYDQVAEATSKDGMPIRYTIKYTNPDGSKGKVIYGRTGELLGGK